VWTPGADRLIVYSPALESEGLKNVVITNPSGESHKLGTSMMGNLAQRSRWMADPIYAVVRAENVLLYSDEYFRLAEADRRLKEDGNKSTQREELKRNSHSSDGSDAGGHAAASTAVARSVSSPAISGGAPLAIDDFVASSKVPRTGLALNRLGVFLEY
jgi:hypothetical protein